MTLTGGKGGSDVNVLSSLPEGALLLDEDMAIKFTNEICKDLFAELGLSADKPGEGIDFIEILERAGFNEDTLKRIKSEIENINDEKAEKAEFREEIALVSDRNKRWFELKAKKYRDGLLVLFEEITELKQEKEKLKVTKTELEETRAELETILESIQDGISVLTPDLTIRYTNNTMEDWSREYTPLLGKKCYEVYHDREEPCDICHVMRSLETGEVASKVEKVGENPELEYLEFYSYPIFDNDTGEIEGVVEISRNITERKRAEKALEIREELYRKIFETAPVGIMLENSEGEILEVNDSICEMSGYEEEELIGSTVLETLTPSEFREEAKDNIERLMRGEDVEFTGVGVRKNGERYYVHINETRVNLPGGDQGILTIQMDVTDRVEKEKKLKHLSYHDSLTGLYNRSFLEEEMERLNTESQLPLSLIMCDVNGMKIVNDTYGHNKGDELLKQIADLLSQKIRDEDLLARWAGDEFVILLPRTDKERAGKVARRIEKGCEDTQFADIPITLGIGVATKNELDVSFKEMISRADEMMYRDKLTKTNSVENRLVQNLLNTLAAKSEETKEHALRMSELANKLGNEIGLSNEQLNKLSLVATLHDIGKTTISEDILTKPDKLSDEEWEIIKSHPEKGYMIASATDEFAPVAKEILHHHEHWNGEGYPEGFAGEEIPLLSRIISIVDAYDVMTAGRPYKEAMTRKEALEELKKCAGSQFDPDLVETFVEMMKTGE